MSKPVSVPPGGYQRVLDRRRADRAYEAQHSKEQRRDWARWDNLVRLRLIEQAEMAGLTRYACPERVRSSRGVTREEFYFS